MFSIADLYAQLGHLVGPGDEAKFRALLSEAQAVLMERSLWSWGRTEATMTVTAGKLYVDQRVYGSLLGVLLDKNPLAVRQRIAEFAPFSTGESTYDVDFVDEGFTNYTPTGESVAVRHRVYRFRREDVADKEVRALLSLRTPIYTISTDGSTLVLCPSLRAIKLAILAVIFEEAADSARADEYWVSAIKAADENERATKGASRPTLPVQFFGEGLPPIANSY